MCEGGIAEGGREAGYQGLLPEEVYERVKVYFEGGEVVDASLVIGADGLRSSVRKYVDVDWKPTYSGRMVLHGMVSKTVLHKRPRGQDQRLPNPSMLFWEGRQFYCLAT